MNEKTNLSLKELSYFEIFKNFSETEVSLLCENAFVKSHSHKQIVFNFDESAHYFGVVLNGAYKLSRLTPGGEDSVIHFSAKGDVVAALIMSQKAPIYPVTVKAMGPSRMLLIPQKTYIDHWLTKPGLVMQIQGLLSTRMTRLQHQKIMLRSPMAPKIASLLLQLVAQDNDTQSAMEIPLPLTRKEIADNLGVSVESVIRVMSEWEKLGIIDTTEQSLIILSPEKLIEILEQE